MLEGNKNDWWALNIFCVLCLIYTLVYIPNVYIRGVGNVAPRHYLIIGRAQISYSSLLKTFAGGDRLSDVSTLWPLSDDT